MIVGIPTEVKNHEYRVAATPEGVRELVHAGHEVVVQAGAGQEAMIPDALYEEAGARIATDPADAWEADVVVKVAPPEDDEIPRLESELADLRKSAN